MSRLIRVFPRRTKATPDDVLVAANRSPQRGDEADEVHVSVSFDWDVPRAEQLADEWRAVSSRVTVGGPAYGTPPADFEPGMYLRRGYVITSRGCPNKCGYCLVPRREGDLRLLPIRDGYNVADNNLLATPKEHQEAVFQMLLRQPEPAVFSGGLEAARLRGWHADWLLRLKPSTIWTAYDSPGDWEAVQTAVGLMRDAGIVAPHKRKRFGVYVLMGWRSDTLEAAEGRLRSVINLGVRSCAMFLNNGAEVSDPAQLPAWRDLRKRYTDAAEVGAMVAETWKG